MNESVLVRLAGLKTASVPQLKKQWRDLFESEPPPYNRRFLESRLADRIQERAYGGVNPATAARVEALADELDGKGSRKPRPLDRPIVGTRLVREYEGVEHHVTVRADGFEYQGRPYRSLSAVARAITGTRWNGPMFFGLRQSGP